MKPILFILALTLIGCTGTKEIITRTDTLRIPYAVDTAITMVLTDTVYQGGTDRIIIRIDTLWKKAYIKIRDTVRTVHTDTLQTLLYRKVDPTPWEIFWMSMEYWVSALLLGLLLSAITIVYLIKKFKA